jgi:hypothetical protein
MTFEASRRKQVLVLQPKGKALYDGECYKQLPIPDDFNEFGYF